MGQIIVLLQLEFGSRNQLLIHVELLSITRQSILVYIHSYLDLRSKNLLLHGKRSILLKRSELISYDLQSSSYLHQLRLSLVSFESLLSQRHSLRIFLRFLLRQRRPYSFLRQMAYRIDRISNDKTAHIHHGWHHDAPCGLIIRNGLNKKYTLHRG